MSCHVSYHQRFKHNDNNRPDDGSLGMTPHKANWPPFSSLKGVARGNFKTRQTLISPALPCLPFPSVLSPPLPSPPLPLEIGALEVGPLESS